MATANADALTMELLSPAFMEDPYPLYQRIRSTEPVLFIEPFNAWILTRFTDVVTAFTDDRFQVLYEQHQVNRMGPEALDQEYFKVGREFLVLNDPPSHTRLKRIFRQPFTSKRVQQLIPFVEQLAHRCVDEFYDAGRVDIAHQYAHRVPVGVMSHLLQVPPEDEDKVIDWVEASYAALFVTPMSPEELEAANGAARRAQDYFLEVIRQRRKAPGADFLSELIAANDADEDPMSDEQIAANVFLLYFAGHDTQKGMFTNIVNALDQHPAALRTLRDDPGRIRSAMRELYRYDTTGQFMGRTATVDIEVGGRTIRQGQTVMVGMGAANRDPDAFPDPDTLDFNRPPAGGGDMHHITFGVGRHHCLGAFMAQSNLPLMLKVLLERVGEFAIDRPAAVRQATLAARAFHVLPITWSV